ncbi:YaiI/YqxD family protein [Ruminococcus sp.]|uniref:YaiI/YqxD family protein n=1 Tax=Ruminococcus sp. TaxID=41978 RepID=UPI0025F15F42|nr:YaiI/YqxD family protein [Ruminococcus sp.]MCI5816559.1 YaiI/YqxD family protein [Ruminococcus sp.]MDD7556050.1 YaiI/YqxD family protein [Ruminococcus sp.]MDY4963687.1 YaiI/YqxD family protein [Ruminococcus callidus]
MHIYIDADGCPVVEQTIRIARQQGIPCTIICDSAHLFRDDYADTITVSTGADSADFRLVNLLRPGDLVITQDYGLAAMCLARQAYAMHQDGGQYTPDNMDGLLAARHTARCIRRQGGRLRGAPKRTPAQDQAFCRALEAWIHKMQTT